jgi:putative ubiquitin-RnfH superfamily antitoxin RatB of RatAB toxin-antitoxin module
METPDSPSTPTRPSDAAGRTARVEVVYALPDQQRVVTLALPVEGLTAGQAVQRSGLLQEFPQIAAQPLALAVFGVTCDAERCLRDGDRVEILRPLRHDPRALRRERAASSGKTRRR